MKHITLLFFVFFLYGLTVAQDNDTIHELNPVLLNPDMAHYHQSTGVYLARMADVAYMTSDGELQELATKHRAEYPDNLVHASMWTNKGRGYDTRFIVWATQKFMVIAFTGTEMKWRDFVTDLKFKVYETSNDAADQKYSYMPSGHAGFRKAVMRLTTETKYLEVIDSLYRMSYPGMEKDSIPVILTGHSLGAALCSMVATPLKHQGFQVGGIYLFAPPLAVACTEIPEMERDFGHITYNLVNFKDYIPRAGLRGSLAHFGEFMRVCSYGLINVEAERYVKFARFERKNVLRYHRLQSHINAVREDCNHEDMINQRLADGRDCFIGMKVVPVCHPPMTEE